MNLRHKKGVKYNVILSVASIIMLCLIIEISGRVVFSIIRGTGKPQRTITRDLGWVTTPNYQSRSLSMIDSGGNLYNRRFQTFKFGFREWGDVSSKKKKILFVGDSFTEASEVSNENTYYSFFQRSMDEEITLFAYGGGGYGTLQEYIIIDKHVDEIEPDVMVLQFCSNDFGNNSLELGKSGILSNQDIRPYWVDDAIVFRFPKWHPYPILLKYSRLFSYIEQRVQFLRLKFNGLYMAKNEWTEDGAWSRSITITSKLMREIRERLPHNTALYSFNCRGPEEDPYLYELFIKVAADNGFIIIPDVAQSVADAETKGAVVRAQDGGHLNNLGNQIMGEQLAKYFNEGFKK